MGFGIDLDVKVDIPSTADAGAVIGQAVAGAAGAVATAVSQVTDVAAGLAGAATGASIRFEPGHRREHARPSCDSDVVSRVDWR